MATLVEIAWAAGLFEGEGCIHIRDEHRSGKHHRQVKVILASTDKDVVEKFASIVGCGVIRERRPTTPGGKIPYEWRCGSYGDAEQVIGLLYEHLGKRRRERADQALEQLALRVDFTKMCKRGHPRTPENLYFAPKTGVRHCLRCRREYRRGWEPRPVA